MTPGGFEETRASDSDQRIEFEPARPGIMKAA